MCILTAFLTARFLLLFGPIVNKRPKSAPGRLTTSCLKIIRGKTFCSVLMYIYNIHVYGSDFNVNFVIEKILNKGYKVKGIAGDLCTGYNTTGVVYTKRIGAGAY